MDIRNFTATKAFIRYQGKILLLRESGHYADGTQKELYDVTGGRINADETLMQGLSREVYEETGIHIKTSREFFVRDVIVKRPDEEWHINAHYFICDVENDHIVLSMDHDDHIWINPQDHKTLQIIPDLTEVFEAYLAI